MSLPSLTSRTMRWNLLKVAPIDHAQVQRGVTHVSTSRLSTEAASSSSGMPVLALRLMPALAMMSPPIRLMCSSSFRR